jgi:hypothetical protein
MRAIGLRHEGIAKTRHRERSIQTAAFGNRRRSEEFFRGAAHHRFEVVDHVGLIIETATMGDIRPACTSPPCFNYPSEAGHPGKLFEIRPYDRIEAAGELSLADVEARCEPSYL